MPVKVTADHLKILAPNARSSYREAFLSVDDVLAKHAINQTPRRLAHFMAQILHECGGLTILVENMNYRAERLMKVWPSRFPTLASAQPFAHDPRALADHVYNGRMGNQPPHDGSTFFGRGLLQITGREAYQTYGEALGIPLAQQPDLAFSPEWALPIAAAEWHAKNCNALADEDSIRKVTKAVNGGLVGLADRIEWLSKTSAIWH